MPANRRAAFFDVDNTLVRGASIFHLARGLRARGILSARALAGFVREQLIFSADGEEKIDHADLRARILRLAVGVKVRDIESMGEQIYDDLIESRVWPGARALVDYHLRRGDEVWLVSATPVEVCAVIARRIGATGGLGTVAEHEHGEYTGRLVGEVLHREGKAHAIRELAAARGIDLRVSYAYSDSSNDLPMLDAVGHPSAVNPDAQLRRVALASGWPVHNWRVRGRVARRAAGSVLGAGLLYLLVRLVRSRG